MLTMRKQASSLCFLIVISLQNLDALVVRPLGNGKIISGRTNDLFHVGRNEIQQQKMQSSSALTSSTVSADAGEHSSSSSFASSTLQSVLTKAKEASKSIICAPHPAHVRRIETIQEYKEHVVDVTDRIVVVRFFATWCRSCKAIEKLFYRTSFRYCNSSSGGVSFVEVPVTKANAFLAEGLGVPSFPYGHIYHPQAGLVEEMRISKPHYKNFEAILACHVQGWCDVPQEGAGIPEYATRVNESACAV